MAYEILMPQLSDSMEEGKLISWKVKEHDIVHVGDVIADVESDKAIMEVQCFKEGEIEKLHIAEGESAPVGSVIVSVKLTTANTAEAKEPLQKNKDEKKAIYISPTQNNTPSLRPLERAIASPKAKLLAQEKGISIHALQKVHKLASPAHFKDIIAYEQRRFFTLKALKLMQQNRLETSDFELNKKHDTQDVQAFIQSDKGVRFKPVDAFRKALIKNIEKSFQKPVFHIYDHLDSSLLQLHSSYGLSAWLVKLFASAMMEFEGFRSCIDGDGISVYTNASVSFAMLGERGLYMPVIKDANLLSVKAIQKRLKALQEEINQKRLRGGQMQGSSFGLSNLGKTGIEGFDALINQDDSGIAAIGTWRDNKISVNLSIDHRLIDGYEAALFMQKLKALCTEEDFFKRNIEDV